MKLEVDTTKDSDLLLINADAKKISTPMIPWGTTKYLSAGIHPIFFVQNEND